MVPNIMISIRRLPCDAGQKVLSTVLSKKRLQPFLYSSNDSQLLLGEKTSWNKFNNFIKSNFHTARVDRDIEDGLKFFGAPLAMLGVIGPGIGLGVLGHGVATGVARNPSASNEILNKSMLALICCEFMGLLATVIAIVFKFI